MRVFFSRAVFFAVALVPALAWAGDDSWRSEMDKDGIQVYTRAVAGASLREMRGVGRFTGTLGSLVAVINDVTVSHELTESVSHSEVKQRDSDRRFQLYTVTNLPWPLQDRDVLNQRDIVQDPHTLAVTITDVATQGLMPPRSGFVRIVNSHQQWTLTPASNGVVQLELDILSDPAGPIPSSIINAEATSVPYKTLHKLIELAQRPAYRGAKLPYIQEPSASP